MISLTGLAGSSFVHALGWTLLHFCWQGVLVGGMLWCVLGLLGGRSSEPRYCAACAAMLLMVGLPLFTFGRIAIADYQMRSAAHRLATEFDMSIFLQEGAGGPVAPWLTRIAVAFDHFMPWLLTAWLLGALFFVVRLNLGLVVARRLRRIGIEPPSGELQKRFDALRERLGVARAVRLLHSARVQVPTVIGWLRPVVLLPASCLTGLSTEQIEAIFCHELAHVRRHDYLVSVFQSLAEALLFYHPVVWWVSKQVRRERECCCDELAVADCGDALAYARALSYLEERRASLPEFVLGANGGVLTMRIKRLLGYTDDAGAPQFAAILLLALVAAMSASYMATLARAQKAVQQTTVAAVATVDGPGAAQQQSAANASVGQPPRGIYASWLTQDARWIITDPERVAYLRLQTDNERDGFITAFWRRRDPPGAADGSYREAYYSRMAYANEHFASNKRVGWSTDRGHVYLQYGKPESIDSHPSGGAYQTRRGPVNLPYPFEVWHYDAIQGFRDNVDVVFVDPCGCGDYSLSADGSGATVSEGAPSVKFKTFEPAARILSATTVGYEPPSAPSHDTQVAQIAGEIYGVIVDPTGALVPRANIRAVNTDTGFTMTALTDNTGTYTFSPLPSGTYNVEVSAAGFQRQLQENVKVSVLQKVALNLKLTVGSASQSLTVTSTQVAAAHAAPPPPPSTGAKITGPLRVSAGVMAGNIISQPDPVYPADAKAAHVQGVVVLHATISKRGEIEDVEVVSGPPSLIVSAIDAVRQWKYKPYLLNGEPTEVATAININYTLGDSATPPGFVWLMPEESPPRLFSSSQTTLPDGASAPVVVHASAPEYTEEAKTAKVSGIVLVNLMVDERGLPQNVHVLRGVGHGLDAKAVEAVKQYRFKPAMKDGKPVEEALNVEVNFQIF